MSLVELKKAIEQEKAEFGMKQALKNKPSKVFICNDARPETEEALKKEGLEILRLKEDKEKVAKDLKLGFLCEVFSLHGAEKKQKEAKEEKSEKKTKIRKEKIQKISEKSSGSFAKEVGSR